MVLPAIFLTGVPGSGKTAVAHEISELLWQLDEPHAVIDLDELGRGVIPGGSEDFNLALVVENLKSVWSNFRATGAQPCTLGAQSMNRRHLFGLTAGLLATPAIASAQSGAWPS